MGITLIKLFFFKFFFLYLKNLVRLANVMGLVPWISVQTQTCTQVAQTHMPVMFGDVTGLTRPPLVVRRQLFSASHTHVDDEVCGSCSVTIFNGSVLPWSHR